MDWNGRFRKIGVCTLMLFLLITPPVYLFFADGGQIYGINYNPDTIPNISGQNLDGLVFTIVDEDIEPIYDGSEIIQVELWELPLRDILLRIITHPMAYIPPSTSYLLSLFYLAFGILIFGIYQGKNGKKTRDPASRREIIYQYILAHPGVSQQQIVDVTGYSRGSVRHQLHELRKNEEITQTKTKGHARYIPCDQDITPEERILLNFLGQKRPRQLICLLLDHPGITTEEIAGLLNITPSTAGWHLRRLNRSDLLIKELRGKKARYTLTDRTVRLCRTVFSGKDPKNGS